MTTVKVLGPKFPTPSHLLLSFLTDFVFCFGSIEDTSRCRYSSHILCLLREQPTANRLLLQPSRAACGSASIAELVRSNRALFTTIKIPTKIKRNEKRSLVPQSSLQLEIASCESGSAPTS
jgi:hypothetical protein